MGLLKFVGGMCVLKHITCLPDYVFMDVFHNVGSTLKISSVRRDDVYFIKVVFFFCCVKYLVLNGFGLNISLTLYLPTFFIKERIGFYVMTPIAGNNVNRIFWTYNSSWQKVNFTIEKAIKVQKGRSGKTLLFVLIGAG